MGHIQKGVRVFGEKQENRIGIYVHIPFCVKKCTYCDFVSIPSLAPPGRRYTSCLLRELETTIDREGIDPSERTIESIYIGGGTPSLIEPDIIEWLIDGIMACFRGSAIPEITLEANPEGLTPERLRAYREAGINRLSIGIQSLDDRLLERLGRIHSSRKAVNAFFMARDSGFDNIGIDLIYGIPGQGVASWRDTLLRTIGLKPEHLSIYALTVEEGTHLWRDIISGRLKRTTEQREIEMYRLGVGLLKDAGYIHYEVSNLSLPGFECRHNLRYWLRKDYIGLGCGAHSFLSFPEWGRRWWNRKEPEEYMRALEGSLSPVDGYERLSRRQAVDETLLLGLRLLNRGIGIKDFSDRFGLDPRDAFAYRTGKEMGLVEERDERVVLTERGILLCDEIVCLNP